jgi:ABC-type antimicrobial peptide transport system permease subunit
MVIWMVLLALLAGFGVANTVLFSVIERTREFGVMGALGMSARRLALVVVTESVLVSMLGFAAAAVGGYFLIGYLAHTGIPLGPAADVMAEIGIPARIYASAEGWYWAASFVVVVVTGAVAAWYPARRAAKLEPVEAIREI